MSERPDRRKPGRPRANEPRTSVSTWIPAGEHDRLIQLANQREQTVSQTVRQILRERLSNS
jgi:hypothetical protein